MPMNSFCILELMIQFDTIEHIADILELDEGLWDEEYCSFLQNDYFCQEVIKILFAWLASEEIDETVCKYQFFCFLLRDM